MDEVTRNHFVIGVFENALEIGFGRILERGLDFRKRGFLDGLHGEVHSGNGRGRHAERHAGEFAGDFRADQRDGLGGTGSGGNDVDCSAAATLPVFLGRAIHGFLRGGVGVDGGHQTLGNAESFLEQHMHQRGKAIGGAACVRDDVMDGRIVEVIVDALNERDVLTLGRCGNDHFFGTGGDVALGFVRFGEKAGGLDDDFHAEFLPRQTIRRAGAHDLDVVAVDDDDVVLLEIRGGLLGGNGACEAALSGVIFQQISEVVRRNDISDGGNVEGGSEVALLDESTEDKAADAAESVDGNGGHGSVWEAPMQLFPPGGAGLCMPKPMRQPPELKAQNMRGF